MTQQTANLNLNKPEMTDKISVSIPQIAANFDIIDSSLSEITSKEIIFSDSKYPRLSGETNDSPRIQRVINALPNGGKITFPYGKSFTLASTLTIDPVNFTTYPLVLDLNGCNLTFTGTGVAFDLLSNAFPSNGAGWNLQGRIILLGNGANIKGTSSATGAIRMNDCIDYMVDNIHVWDFTNGFGFQIYVSSTNRWCEENVISNCWTRNTLTGYQTSVVTGTGTSMNHTVFRNCKANLGINNAKGFDLTGNHSRSILDTCGGWVAENSATGTLMFNLNGVFPQGIMINPWCDGLPSNTNCIGFGTGYTTGQGADRTNCVTITNANKQYFLLPTNAHQNINLLSYTDTPSANVFHDEMGGTGDFTIPATALIGHERGGRFLTGTANTVQYWTRTLNTTFSKIMAINLTPFTGSSTDNSIAQAIGTYGVATLNKDANNNVISVTFFWNPTATKNANFYYEIVGIKTY